MTIGNWEITWHSFGPGPYAIRSIGARIVIVDSDMECVFLLWRGALTIERATNR